jgi:hypothetical protein
MSDFKYKVGDKFLDTESNEHLTITHHVLHHGPMFNTETNTFVVYGKELVYFVTPSYKLLDGKGYTFSYNALDFNNNDTYVKVA